jgi:hypothetical protein
MQCNIITNLQTSNECGWFFFPSLNLNYCQETEDSVKTLPSYMTTTQALASIYQAVALTGL